MPLDTIYSLTLRDPEVSDSTMSRQYTPGEVSLHYKSNDIYLIIKDKVYDVTNFQYEHP